MSHQRLHVLTLIMLILALGGLVGCASVPDSYRDPRDPWQSYNRTMHQFNSDFDKTVWTPLAKGYKAITPEPVDRGITNMFNNLRDVVSLLNNVLQFKLSRAVSDTGRVLVNTTVGLVGFLDVASNLDMPSYKEDFGQTLGYWGVGSGPYLELPFLGSSDLRDSISLVPDWYSQPLAYLKDQDIAWGLVGLQAVDTRADLLGASKVLEDASFDPYSFTRDAYLQKRRSAVYDGNPPSEDEKDTPPKDSSHQ